MADKNQQLQARKQFILSLKQLRHFFNNLKEVHSQYDTTLELLHSFDVKPNLVEEALAAKVINQEYLLQSPEELKLKEKKLEDLKQFQLRQKKMLDDLMTEIDTITVTAEDLNVKVNPDTKYFEQSIEAIQQATKFTELIKTQENQSLVEQIQKKQAVVDVCDAENRDLQQQLDNLLQQVSFESNNNVDRRQKSSGAIDQRRYQERRIAHG